jgi:pimeloyl-ACP methyl ester carboxylesterase
MRWAEEVIRHFVQLDGRVGLTYDPALRVAFDAAMAAPPVDAWPLFDACAGIPLALIRGANSDVLSCATADAMRVRDPELNYVEVPCRGHAPFLDEPQALACIRGWLAQVTRLELGFVSTTSGADCVVSA